MSRKKDRLKKLREAWTGLNDDEIKLAENLFNIYTKKHHIDKFSDIGDLRLLVYNEILLKRVQQDILKYNTDNKFPPKTTLDAFTTLQNQVLTLKQRLGLFEEKGKDDLFIYLQRLKKKFKVWQSENVASRTIVCPHCSKMVLLQIRTDKYDAKKHPFFKDKVLYNEHAIKLLKEGKISKMDVAKIIQGVDVRSTDYIDWILEKIEKPSDKKSE